MLDLILRNGWVVDGTGAPRPACRRRRAGRPHRRHRRRRRVGASRRIDCDGLVVAPGFVDPHTHYDAQIMWDPAVTPSSLHGVTTVIGGNCGFTIAPMEPPARRVPDPDAGARRGHARSTRSWPASTSSWKSFGSWLDRLDDNVAVNAGFLCGHSTLRRLVMGDAAVGETGEPRADRGDGRAAAREPRRRRARASRRRWARRTTTTTATRCRRATPRARRCSSCAARSPITRARGSSSSRSIERMFTDDERRAHGRHVGRGGWALAQLEPPRRAPGRRRGREPGEQARRVRRGARARRARGRAHAAGADDDAPVVRDRLLLGHAARLERSHARADGQRAAARRRRRCGADARRRAARRRRAATPTGPTRS